MLRYVLGRFLFFGVLGWAVENIVEPPSEGGLHWSPWVPRYTPWIPAYALAGVMLGELAPVLRALPLPARAGVYAVGSTAFELLACHVDRALGGHTWDYGKGLGVDAKHTAMWTAAALVVEPFLR